MLENWEYEFTQLILNRGKKYFADGRVDCLRREGNTYYASVVGTENYEVQISFDNEDMINRVTCTCPYARENNCKHMAAVLLAIEDTWHNFTGCLLESDEEDDLDEDDEDENGSLPWYDAIERLPAESLRRFLLDYADRNNEIREYLAIWYYHGLPEGLLSKWKANLQSYASYCSAGGKYIHEDEVTSFIRGVRSVFTDRYALLISVGATMDAFYWLGTVFEIVTQRVRIDPYGKFVRFWEECVEDWEALLQKATEEQQEQMYFWFWEHRVAFFAHTSGVTDVDFLYFRWDEQLERKGLEIVDGLIEKSRSKRELEILMDCRIEIMDSLDCSDKEVWSFWEKYLNHDYARHRLLKAYHGHPEYHVHIIPLLKRIKEIDAEDLPRWIRDSVWLALMYRYCGEQAAYDAEASAILQMCREKLETEIPHVWDRASARRFISCLDALRELPGEKVTALIDYMVDRVCSNSAIVRKGIVEMINKAGYEWPKPYRKPFQ